jgi:2,3-bisphosphoglycerate-independent phosphoglycerate mutase
MCGNVMDKQKVIMIIRDGWGYRETKTDNAIAQTQTPNTDKLMQNYPNTLLDCSGGAVGLPDGYQGNSEVGHMTIGAGRIIYQSLERINNAIKDKTFFENNAFLSAINNAKKNNSALHLIGLFQVEGVHSHLDHLIALLDLCKQQKFENVKIHAITDGRDAPVTSSLKHIKTIEKKIKEIKFGEIVTISGRFYAMDRDTRWERTQLAYDCIVKAESEIEFDKAQTTIKLSHGEGKTDEFIVPRKKKSYEGVSDKDSIIFFNFRTDRTRQLTKAIIDADFDGFPRTKLDVFFVAMTQFYSPMNAKVAFLDDPLNNLLGEVISKNNMRQLRISETEKYAHVTFFFNGQNEEPYKGEERILIPSPKVATYDKKPEMSAYQVTDKLIEQIEKDKFDFIVVNLVNGDMVGHTADAYAISQAIKTVDDCVGKITAKGLEKNYCLLVLADHGNAEDQTKEFATSHTLNPVPFIVVSNDTKLKTVKLFEGKGLKDVAPTVLDILKISKPKEMSGSSIIK